MDISWTSLFTGVAGGIIPAAVAYYMGKRTVEASLKINAEKIDADRGNLKLQLEQKEKELAAQFKMQTEKLHSDDIKRVCNDFLSCTNPMLFSKDLFDFDTMVRCTSPLYLYCNEEYFSYFENVALFIVRRNLSKFGKQYTFVCGTIANIKIYINDLRSQSAVTPDSKSEINAKIEMHDHELENFEKREIFLADMLTSYSAHHKLALDAAKKLIWGEPITKAEPLNLPELSEDDEL